MGSSRRQPRLGRLAGVLLRTQPDDRLATLVREGGTRPFDEIVRRHRPALTAFARSLAPASRAEDVVQESLLKAYAALRDGAQPALLRAWLFRIVRNTAIDEQRGIRHYEQLDESHDGVEQPPQALDRHQQVASLVAAIKDLPAAQRDAIVKRELEGRGHEEIAQALSISPGAVRQLIYRARHSLRKAAGAIVPVALIRVASVPGAGEAAGGLGLAGVVKLGLAAIVATGTVVAGTAIDRGGATGSASPSGSPSSGATRGPAGGNGLEALTERPGGPNERPADSRSRTEGGSVQPGSSEDHGASGTSGSSGDGSGSNSGPGSSDSGTGTSSSGDGGSSHDATTSSDGGSSSSDGISGSGGTSTATTTTTTSSDGPH